MEKTKFQKLVEKVGIDELWAAGNLDYDYNVGICIAVLRNNCEDYDEADKLLHFLQHEPQDNIAQAVTFSDLVESLKCTLDGFLTYGCRPGREEEVAKAIPMYKRVIEVLSDDIQHPMYQTEEWEKDMEQKRAEHEYLWQHMFADAEPIVLN